MNKKLMAVAVAGALAAPAAVMAQSTVQMYGSVYMEYSFVNQGTSANGLSDAANVDMLQTPGSNIGFKGEEKLGGGMSAWFQCESSADFRGVNGDGFCTRNSAIGFKGGLGNAFIGIWDTPFKRTIGNVGARDTGIFGSAGLLAGNSTSTTDGASNGVFKRRQRNSINYDSPNFGGFQFMGAMSSTNSSTGVTSTSPQAKPRIWSVAASYKMGALDLGAGWEQHTKAYVGGGDEDGYQLSAAYTLGNGLKMGFMFTEQNADTAVGANAEVQAYQLGVEWKIAGPHNVHLGYTVADDMEGTVGAAMGSRPVVAAGGDTGAKMWQIRYVHDLSKRTWVGVGYVQLKADNNANYTLGGLSGAANGNGGKDRAFALNMNHRF
jgi:predicted porin